MGGAARKHCCGAVRKKENPEHRRRDREERTRANTKDQQRKQLEGPMLPPERIAYKTARYTVHGIKSKDLSNVIAVNFT